MMRMLIKIIRHPFSEWLTISFCLTMFTFAVELKDWVGMVVTFYPLNLLLIHYITRKQMSECLQCIIILTISFLYLLYIWTPLTDGTLEQIIIETRNG